MSKEAKIQKTLARQQQKIEEGQFYEAHQQLRVLAARYIKSSDWTSAVDLLSKGAGLLLDADQGASGGDLCLYLIEVYGKAEITPDGASRDRLLGLLRKVKRGEPMKRRFVAEMVGWSSKYGEYPAGDPELHHVAGTIFAEDHEPYDAEHHLALGTRDSPSSLANLEYNWYTLTGEPHTAPLFAARSIFPYLLVGNLHAANQCYLLFTSKLTSDNPGLASQAVNSGPLTTFSTDKSTNPPSPSTSSKPPNLDFRVHPSLPLLNFLGLLLLAIQRGAPELFRTLKTHYKEQLKELDGSWDEALAQVGEMYFGIRIPNQSNPLMDMMGSFLMGGNAPKKQGRQGNRIEGTSSPAPAPAPAID
ncbi:MAG: hypothetical protein M1820_009085 [Bogoriella megaspora]|nr:MAG: hypothetical protein M1820_009085 [Bogoriella megaspora]